jgi:hypothetical protein
MRPLRIVASIALVLAGAVPALVAACSGGSNDSLGGIGPHDGQDGSIGSGSEDALLGLVVDVGVDTGPPLNSVDAADRPEGGTKVTPGVILCPNVGTCNAFAGQQCCLGDDGGACLSTSRTCAPGGSFTCNESADCIVGTVCCGIYAYDEAGAGPYLSSTCAASCTTSHVQLCRTNGECGDAGPCVIEPCSDGLVHEFCGGFNPTLPDGGAFFEDGGDDGGAQPQDDGGDEGGAAFTCTPPVNEE